MVNNAHSNVKGISKIRNVRPDRSMVILTNVRYMLNMSRNLRSYGMLEQPGFKYEENDVMIHFYKYGKETICKM